MKTIFKTVQDIIKDGDSPLPLKVIPNYMGINLVSVEGVSWTKQDDDQLVSLTIHFKPSRKIKITLEIEAELRHEDASHDQRVKDELSSAIMFAATENTLLYEVDGQEYHAPAQVSLRW